MVVYGVRRGLYCFIFFGKVIRGRAIGRASTQWPGSTQGGLYGHQGGGSAVEAETATTSGEFEDPTEAIDVATVQRGQEGDARLAARDAPNSLFLPHLTSRPPASRPASEIAVGIPPSVMCGVARKPEERRE